MAQPPPLGNVTVTPLHPSTSQPTNGRELHYISDLLIYIHKKKTKKDLRAFAREWESEKERRAWRYKSRGHWCNTPASRPPQWLAISIWFSPSREGGVNQWAAESAAPPLMGRARAAQQQQTYTDKQCVCTPLADGHGDDRCFFFLWLVCFVYSWWVEDQTDGQVDWWIDGGLDGWKDESMDR